MSIRAHYPWVQGREGKKAFFSPGQVNTPPIPTGSQKCHPDKPQAVHNCRHSFQWKAKYEEAEREKCRANITGGFRVWPNRELCLFAPAGPGLPPKNVFSVSSVLCWKPKRVEFTQGPRTGWRGCRCSSAPPLPTRSGRLLSSSPGPLGPSPPRLSPAPAAGPALPRPAGAAASPSRRESGGARERGGIWLAAPAFPLCSRDEEKPVAGRKGRGN